MQKAQNMAHPVPDLSHRLSELEKEQKRLEKELKELPELADAFRLFRKDFDYQCKVFKRLDKLIEDYGQQSKDVGDRHKEKLKDHELRFKAFRKEIADIKAENDMDMSDLRQEVDRRLNAMNKSLESFHSEANHMNARNVEMLKEHRAKINDRLDQTADDSRKVVDDVKQNIAQFKDMCEMVDLIKKEIHL
ncbi:MAG: hypothetical protein GWN61_23870, partial [candidate division Zixibacteria bacterium]|nr:hypothetical protein [candidate division Zixibacteria bacterium]NIR52646.1 hypothetical protein [candidate division KSB1 bacterium]NIR67640.1 hypothetical protein [candidate division Zixibacteria bacterium]NIS48898.1 hypothetical protein [candidate division Zixibacteria bacterium]NIT74829.1 hypothetical protein [candidate division KSB1 bacterium]